MKDERYSISSLNSNGQEIFDQTPVTIPIKFERPVPLHIRIRNQILQAQSLLKSSEEFETPEEADDFSVDDDPDLWSSPYEGDFDHINKPLNEVFDNNPSAKSAESSPHDEAETAEGVKPEA